MKILNYGSCSIDNVYKVSHFVRPGETIASLSFDVYPGGKGLNQSIALAHAGASTIHAGKVGKDGEWLRSLLKTKGVDVEHLKIVDGPSGHANIQVNEHGENAIVIVGGTNRDIVPDDFPAVFSDVKSGDFLLLQNEVSHLKDIINFGYEKGLRLVFNAAPMTQEVLDLPLDKLEYLFVNKTEAAELANTKDTDPDVLLVQLSLMLPNTHIVLTLGSNGAKVRYNQNSWYQPGFPVATLDTTGAGDTFTGFFLACIAEGLPLQNCLERACKAASISVTRRGAATSIPLLSEVLEP